MSKTPATKPPTTKHCFARRHLNNKGESALYSYMLAASQRDGEFRSDARRDAWDLDVNKDSITAWTKSLLEKGWIILTKPSHRNPLTGAFSPAHYRILSHEQWVGKYGSDTCRYIQDYYASATLLENPGNQQLEHDRLSDETGLAQSDETGQALSETSRSACPKRAVSPVRPFRTKRVVKEVSKESEEEKNQNCPPSLPTAIPKEKNQDLADLAVATAIETNPAASFSGKSKAEVVRIIEEIGPTEEELTASVRAIVNQLDDFQLRNAGSTIAASLAGHIIATRKKKVKDEQQAVIHEQEMRVVQEEVAARDREWEEKKAKVKAENDRLQYTHYPDDCLCSCEKCQPDFWKDRDDNDGVVFLATI